MGKAGATFVGGLPLPDSIRDEIGAQMLINTVTALTVIRAAHDSIPREERRADIALARRLAYEPGALFEVAERYSPSRIADAVTHVGQAGRASVVLIDFSKD